MWSTNYIRFCKEEGVLTDSYIYYLCILYLFTFICFDQKDQFFIHQGVNVLDMTKLQLNWLLRLKWVDWL